PQGTCGSRNSRASARGSSAEGCGAADTAVNVSHWRVVAADQGMAPVRCHSCGTVFSPGKLHRQCSCGPAVACTRHHPGLGAGSHDAALERPTEPVAFQSPRLGSSITILTAVR